MKSGMRYLLRFVEIVEIRASSAVLSFDLQDQ
jgi:hypothetical protein